MSQTSNASRSRTEFAGDNVLAGFPARGDQEPRVRQRVCMMGHPPSPRDDDLALRFDAAPPPSLEITDALRRRRLIEEAGTRARLSF